MIWELIKQLPELIWNLIKGTVELIATGIGTIVDFVSNLFVNLLEFIKFILIPSDNFFTDNFQTIETLIADKLNLDMSEIESLKNITEVNPIVAPIEFKIMGVPVSLDFTFVTKIRDMTRTISSGLVGIFICWFHYKKIIWLIRGNAPTDGGGKK